MRDYYEGALNGEVTIVSYGLHRFVLALPPTNMELGASEMAQSGHISPMLDEGTVIGTVTTIEDVSERLASESELRRQIEAQKSARSTAENALRAKDEFLATLSHEIRTPLNAVLGWSRILMGRDTVDPALLKRALQVIERNASAQTKMIDDMLDMARIVSGKLRLDMQPVDVLGAVMAAVDVIMPAAAAKRINLRTAVDPQVPRVLADQDRLQQIVWNLLSNALKFTPPGGTVEVRLGLTKASARIVVSDTGQGITPEFLPYVFDRFQQSDATSTRRHGGLGLGLALVRDLVALHGGTVRAESPGEGQGATFTIDLPLSISPDVRTSHPGPAMPEGNERSLAGVHVLLVEDEADARDLSITVLEQSGARVTAVASSADAVAALSDRARADVPNVLVSDIAMAGEDGYELMRRIRMLEPARGGSIPAIALTGYASSDDVNRAMEAGYQLHVAKPMNPDALIQAVASLVCQGDRTP
jgi:signal transduction histidine kinase/ActR/RegA family two-component response regulator